jgi:hypothetical protein
MVHICFIAELLLGGLNSLWDSIHASDGSQKAAHLFQSLLSEVPFLSGSLHLSQLLPPLVFQEMIYALHCTFPPLIPPDIRRFRIAQDVLNASNHIFILELKGGLPISE